MRRAFGVVRLVAAAGGTFTLLAFLLYTLGVSGPVFANFVSYFTVQCTFVAVIVWAIAGTDAVRRSLDPHWLTRARLFVTTYLIVSGIVFTIIHLEAAARDVPLGLPWSSQVLHYVLPSYALLDWIFAPGRHALPWRALPTVLVFPLLWGGYTVIRGSLIGWYPYFFLDANQVPPSETLAYSSVAGALFLAVAAFLLLLDRLSSRAPRRIKLERPSPNSPGSPSSSLRTREG